MTTMTEKTKVDPIDVVVAGIQYAFDTLFIC